MMDDGTVLLTLRSVLLTLRSVLLTLRSVLLTGRERGASSRSLPVAVLTQSLVPQNHIDGRILPSATEIAMYSTLTPYPEDEPLDPLLTPSDVGASFQQLMPRH
jgi:hypothetical protein